MISSVRHALGQLWPLSATYEYADLLGHSLSAPRVGPLASWQAEGLERLRVAERSRPRHELEDELVEVIDSGPDFLRLALEAELASLDRDWSERGIASSAPLSVAGEVELYAPEECVSYSEGYAAPLDWTLAALGGAKVTRRQAPPATDAQLALAHDPLYLQGIFSLGRDGGMLTPETRVTPKSEAAIRAGAGALVDAAMQALEGSRPLLVAARPGSHHASRTRGGGTCLVNGLAVAAYSVLADGLKVGILDLDAHHGNGTEEIFWREPRVLTASVHQAAPFFPGTGSEDAVGAGAGRGTNLNLPVAPEESWRTAAVRAVEWLGDVDLVLIELSADAHEADPASDLHATDSDFVAVGKLLRDRPVVVELGSSLSERAWTGAVRGFVSGLTNQD